MNQRNTTRNQYAPEEKPRRIYALASLIVLLAVIILLRLYSLQVFSYDFYQSLAQNQHHIFQELIPRRGEIFLKNGQSGHYPLAINRDWSMAYVVPREVEDIDKTVFSLVSVFGVEEEYVRRKLEDKEDLFEIIKHKVSEEESDKLKSLDLKGVHLMPETFRYYPGERLASQIVGFVGWNGDIFSGRYGLESFWDKELGGESGSLSQERDAGGRWISTQKRQFQPARDGANLLLTIDYAVQYEVEKILKETVEKHGAENGSIIVMEPESGKLLAMANYPDFNPNEYSVAEDMSVFSNQVVSTPYECGSVFKPITMAIGIDDGKVSPETTYIDTGSVAEGGYVIQNSEGKTYGKQTMTQVLEESINTGVVFVEKQVGNEKFAEYVKRFGFGEKNGIDLSSEAPGNIQNLNYLNRDIQFFTASYGQGISVTLLQLASAYSAIANGGKLMKSQIVEKMTFGDGEEKILEQEEIRRVIGKDTARQVAWMLRSVVVNGHGKRADVPGYLVGGKTGTAQVAKEGEKGYEEGVTVGSFAGFAPVDDAKFTVVVRIFNPKDVQWAESTAAPAFGKVMKFLLEYYKIEPTEEIEYKDLKYAK